MTNLNLNNEDYEVALVIDQDDVIQSVSSAWEQVADKGGASESLQTEKVIGQPLSQFIRSDATRMYIEACLKVCRLKQQVMSREYRCDSPTHKRFMALQLTPLAEGAVEMRHFLLREEPFDYPVNLEDVTPSEQTTEIKPYSYVRCSMCNSLKKVGTQDWTLPEHMGRQLMAKTKVIHSVCPVCQNKIWQKR
ncbi:hypothetical protein [Thiomicrospira microaerophila]|uniref:hypothetical protein n=1 Tax=Thiomicrospira microaerophila TaxID=406020 RepID=UPI0005C95218|nr:hypothetical protein [Thiomicrospira microaerophila]